MEQPVTAWDALRWAGAELRDAMADSPRLAAEVLLAHALGWERARLLGHIHDPLPAESWEKFQVLVRRGTAGEPLQYLTARQEFYGLTFRVTPAALIPRPETELLVEKAVELARTGAAGVRFVDVGTGCGCIAIAVAHELTSARGWATDISLEALALARENAGLLGTDTRLAFVRSDLLESFQARPLFDLILSNLPYISRADFDRLPRMVREFEPREALFGGESGLEAYGRLIPQAAARLAPEGNLLLEVGAGQAAEVGAMARQAGLSQLAVIKDLQGIPRCIVAGKSVPKTYHSKT